MLKVPSKHIHFTIHLQMKSFPPLAFHPTDYFLFFYRCAITVLAETNKSRVQTWYEMCHSLILVLPWELRDELAKNGQKIDLLFALSRLSILIFMMSIFQICAWSKTNSVHFTELQYLSLLRHVCVLHCGVCAHVYVSKTTVVCLCGCVHVCVCVLKVMTPSCL